ncbi:MAG: hypothetical protein ACYC5S_05140 [Thiobacillus sp.]
MHAFKPRIFFDHQGLLRATGFCLAALIEISIGAATNPYIGKFDYLWIVLLPHLLADAVRYQSTDRRRRMPEPV